MDDLTKYLYDFVCKKRMGSIYQDPEYEEAVRSVELQSQKVRSGMDEKQTMEFNILMDSMAALSSIESEHLFLAALRLTRELDRVSSIS